MSRKRPERQQFLEIILIVICVALCALLYRVGNYRMVVLNLFYLPIVLAAFFLGRYRAGILALLSVICASVVIALNLNTFAASTSPLAIGLALTIWGAVMGINAILAGTLSDESTQKIDELHDAYLGVVEVLVRYLNSADPKLKDQAMRLSEISQQVAVQMRLSDTEIDNIRVAALLQDIDSIEVTARVIRKAVGDLTHDNRKKQLENTFHGRDLVQALGSVLTGALPLLVCHGESLNKVETDDGISSYVEPALGTKILRTVRRYLTLRSQDPRMTNPRHAINVMKNDLEGSHHPAVIHALEQALIHSAEKASSHKHAELVTADN
ncbi:MAG TPA: HD domain-containing phosphohydrolase [Thermoguttaceae bacterium]